MFDTDLTREYAAVASLGINPRALYEAAVQGALCGETTRANLAQIGADYDWPLPVGAGQGLAEDAAGLPAALEEH
jgi:hypothetical protein